ncbi:MAG: glycosyltransferase family 9 protein [Bacteroidota bacterium]
MANINESIKKILLVRTDRIGDVVLSLPMLPALKQKFPDAKITVMVRPYTRELVENHSCVDDVILWDESKGIGHYVALLKEKNFDMAIIPYPRFNLALITFLSGIPIRVGTGFRWYSFLFNRRIYEHRKDAKRHEVEYNLNLLTTIGIDPLPESKFEFSASKEAEQTVAMKLAKDSVERFAVIHPGSGGSARDWSVENFAKLGDEIQQQFGLKIVLTGGKNESELVGRVASAMRTPSLNYVGAFSITELGALYRRAALFAANSTGPLHIAAMMGTPVVAFYPPIIQCSPLRWGPYTEKKKVFTADNTACALCKGGPCQSNLCMDQITVEQVITGIRELLNEKK